MPLSVLEGSIILLLALKEPLNSSEPLLIWHVRLFLERHHQLCITAIFRDGHFHLPSILDLRSPSYDEASCRAGKYSFSQRFQNMSEMCCTRRQRRLLQLSSLPKDPTGLLGFDLNDNKCFGVRGSRSLGSLLTNVKGRLFKIPATSAMRVCSISSVKSCCPSKAIRILRIDSFPRFTDKRCSRGIKFPDDVFLTKKVVNRCLVPFT